MTDNAPKDKPHHTSAAEAVAGFLWFLFLLLVIGSLFMGFIGCLYPHTHHTNVYDFTLGYVLGYETEKHLLEKKNDPKTGDTKVTNNDLFINLYTSKLLDEFFSSKIKLVINNNSKLTFRDVKLSNNNISSNYGNNSYTTLYIDKFDKLTTNIKILEKHLLDVYFSKESEIDVKRIEDVLTERISVILNQPINTPLTDSPLYGTKWSVSTDGVKFIVKCTPKEPNLEYNVNIFDPYFKITDSKTPGTFDISFKFETANTENAHAFDLDIVKKYSKTLKEKFTTFLSTLKYISDNNNFSIEHVDELTELFNKL